MEKEGKEGEARTTQPLGDCLSCRMIGTGTLSGVGLYLLFERSQLSVVTAKNQRLFLATAAAGLSLLDENHPHRTRSSLLFLPVIVGFLTAGIYRFFK